MLFAVLTICTSFTAVKKELPVIQQEDAVAMEISLNKAREQVLKLMTFNMRYGVGVDDCLDLNRVIETIRDTDADIIALNEVDHLMPRSNMQKQDKIIAEQLGLYFAYGYNINLGSKYGNVLLSRFPIKSFTNHPLPKSSFSEPRGLIEADLDVEGNHIKVFVTHLSIKTKERPEQISFIEKKIKESEGPTILMGDFNSLPHSDEMKSLLDLMKDTAMEEYCTYPSYQPEARKDYILVSDAFEIKSNKYIGTQSSDHLPVVAEVVLDQ